MAVLLAKQQLSEYSMEAEKKYGKGFPEFDHDFQTQEASYEMKWKMIG